METRRRTLWSHESLFCFFFFLNTLRLISCQSTQEAYESAPRPVSIGFPDSWDVSTLSNKNCMITFKGDKYQELYCPAKNIPKFLDGYFLCQLSGMHSVNKANKVMFSFLWRSECSTWTQTITYDWCYRSSGVLSYQQWPGCIFRSVLSSKALQDMGVLRSKHEVFN